MNIIAADDEKNALEELVYEIKRAAPDAEVIPFSSAADVLDHTLHNKCDVAFLDIEMPEINGITLAKLMKKNLPELNIIFVTGYSKYSIPAHTLHVSGYLLKPVTKEMIENELQNLRYPVRDNAGVRAVTFGQFELTVNGEQVHFSRSKSKEMLAYLIDQHGRKVTKKEAALILFENKLYNSQIQDYMKKIVADLRESLHAVNADSILSFGYNSFSVNTDAFSCDFYEYEAGDVSAINSFHGKYMSQYSWAENTLGRL